MTKDSLATQSFFPDSCRPDNMDSFYVRRSIAMAMLQSTDRFKGVFLDLGAGEQPYRDWLESSCPDLQTYIAVDIPSPYYNREPDRFWDGKVIPLEDGEANTVMLTEVLEHCPEPLQVLKEIHRVMASDSVLFLTVPFLWPLHDVPYDEFRYTPFALQRMLREAGFEVEESDIWALGGTDAALATALGLWANRHVKEGWRRSLARAAVYPFVRLLLRLNGRRKSIRFTHSELITGLAALVHKR